MTQMNWNSNLGAATRYYPGPGVVDWIGEASSSPVHVHGPLLVTVNVLVCGLRPLSLAFF
jgi:hypothetical protein